MGRRSIGWLALVASTSCSLLTPLDGFSNGDARSSPDGSSPAVEGGGDGADGGTDAPPAREDGGTSCATLSPAPRLCVDFSNGIVTSTGTPTSSSFERSDAIGASAPSIDRAIFRSPDASARFAFTGGGTRSYLERRFPGAPPSAVEFSMAMRLDPTTDSPELDLMELRLGDGAGLFLQRNIDGILSLHTYSSGQTSRTIAVPTKMPSSRFATYAWVLDLGAGPTVSMSIDGSEVVTRAPLLTFAAPAHMTFIAGCTDYRTQASAVLWIDDVIVRF